LLKRFQNAAGDAFTRQQLAQPAVQQLITNANAALPPSSKLVPLIASLHPAVVP
jgi:hypothetical protein